MLKIEAIADELGISRSVKVLVVDNNPVDLRTIEDHLAASPIETDVTVTADGMDALLLLGSVKPDVLFLDIRMPGLDGLELQRRISQFDGLGDSRSVFVTSVTDEATLAEAREMPNTIGVLRKPVGRAEVDRMLGLVTGEIGLFNDDSGRHPGS